MSDDDQDDKPRHPGDMLFEHARRQKEQRATQRPDPPPGVPVVDGTAAVDEVTARYVARAVDNETADLASTGEGSRNQRLNKAAFSLGQLVGAGLLDETTMRDRLTHAARTAGLEPGETARSIQSGLTAGRETPRHVNLTATTSPDQIQEVDPHTLTPGGDDTPPPDDDEQAAFWNGDPWRAHIYATARARRCSPWAVLGVVLARVITLTPPTIVLPPIVGGQASLNLFTGLVGPSGSGKGAAERVAADAIYTTHITTLTTGSGEGVGHAYRKRNRNGEQETVNTAVLFSVPEIDTLSALGNRKGATLMPELRRAWSGEALGFAYADPAKRLLVEPHSYRMCLVAGIQPARADALLDDADGGTPQRFGWMPATDPDAPDVAPDCPPPLTWQPPSFNRGDLRGPRTHGRMEIPVCDTARTTIDAAHLARARGEGDALDGHLLLQQLKTAAALAILDGRLEVTDADWDAADVMIRVSSATRSAVARMLRERVQARNAATALAEADRAEIVAERTTEAAHRRVCRHIIRKLPADGEPRPRHELRNSLASRDRGVFDAALDALIQAGQIGQEGDGYGTRYKRL